ncbi:MULTISPECIES: hypothetical protein [Cupriavidus]|uniref:Uncharacterized protein n=1 Tax=Cupriavidus taiwanensis TaxID=164546 RepID=A0A375JAT7_9BURK|nr:MULTISPECIES: hypothetical protein [Cupriavidus]SPS02218.1 hypothetical protein CBM2634_P20003 [Cupriavidus taiwanensis]
MTNFDTMTATATKLTAEQEVFVANAIELGKAQIQQEIASGRIPPTVKTFSELHDFVDANEFGGLCADEGDLPRLFPRITESDAEAFCEAANQVQQALDTWLASGMEKASILISSLVEDALHAACLAVQERLKIDYGDVAGVFFSGTQKEDFDAMFSRYVLCEIGMLTSPDDE